MSGISKLMRPEDLCATLQLAGSSGLPYAFKMSFFGGNQSPFSQPPVWPTYKVMLVQQLLGIDSVSISHPNGSPTAMFCLPLQEGDLRAIAETLMPTDGGPLADTVPDENGGGRLLFPAEVKALKIPLLPGALYRAITIAHYDMGFDLDEPGTHLRTVDGWDEVGIRYVGELFGSACYFRRMYDSQVLVIQIDHDAEEQEILRELVAQDVA